MRPLSDILIWFAERDQNPICLRKITNRLGLVRPELEHLAQLGLLNAWMDCRTNDMSYSLKNYGSYQMKKAA